MFDSADDPSRARVTQCPQGLLDRSKHSHSRSRFLSDVTLLQRVTAAAIFSSHNRPSRHLATYLYTPRVQISNKKLVGEKDRINIKSNAKQKFCPWGQYLS